jgi:hypothetical protein
MHSFLSTPLCAAAASTHPRHAVSVGVIVIEVEN